MFGEKDDVLVPVQSTVTRMGHSQDHSSFSEQISAGSTPTSHPLATSHPK
jgi:hypothetical protein